MIKGDNAMIKGGDIMMKGGDVLRKDLTESTMLIQSNKKLILSVFRDAQADSIYIMGENSVD